MVLTVDPTTHTLNKTANEIKSAVDAGQICYITITIPGSPNKYIVVYLLEIGFSSRGVSAIFAGLTAVGNDDHIEANPKYIFYGSNGDSPLTLYE